MQAFDVISSSFFDCFVLYSTAILTVCPGKTLYKRFGSVQNVTSPSDRLHVAPLLEDPLKGSMDAWYGAAAVRDACEWSLQMKDRFAVRRAVPHRTVQYLSDMCRSRLLHCTVLYVHSAS
jgi:hypothetical protein